MGLRVANGHVYFVSIGPKIAKIFEKFAAIKSLLNPHFKGFGAITRSGFCWSCFSDHFGMVDVPFRPMDDHFVTILVFFAVFVGRRVPFFGHSLLSYSKRRHLSTSRVIPLIDCHQSLYHQHRILSTFLPDLCFIWQSHRFQFLVFALPIGIWQLLMNLQHVTVCLLYTSPSPRD